MEMKPSIKLPLAAAALVLVVAAGALLLYWQWRPVTQGDGASPAPAAGASAPGVRSSDKRLFLDALQSDSITQAAALLAKNPALATVRRTEDGATPLHMARSVAMAKLLLAAGADVNARDWHSRATPLRWAAGRLFANNQSERKLVVFLRPISAPETDIFFATAVGDTAMMDQLLSRDPSLIEKVSSDNDVLYDSSTPLQIAAYAGQYLAAKLLLDRGADVHNRSGWKNTEALEKAAWAGNSDVAALLVERGAKVNGTDKFYEHCPLYAAAMMGRPAIVKTLLAHGAVIKPTLTNEVRNIMGHMHEDEDSPAAGTIDDYHQVIALLSATTQPSAH